MQKFKEELSAYATRTNDALRLLLHGASCPQIAVIDAMRYSLLDAGKRIRAALTLEFGRLCGAPREGAMQFACAVEMIHAYSLIHDDLPCMDDDDLRRGKPACHKQFGESTALLAGDGLLTLAFETLACAPMLDDTRRIEAIRALSKAAGVYGMVGGQVVDLASEGKQISREQLEHLYALKTGALLGVSAELGCIAGGADTALRQAAQHYTSAVGLAFQITDDILDVAGDQQALGKPVGSDEQNEKTTFVSLLGLSGARQAAEAQIADAQRAVAEIPDNSFLIRLAEMILSRDH